MRTSGQSARLLLLTLALINLGSVCHGLEYTVGGTSQKWAFPPNSSYTYDNEWAKNITFQVGDQLIFIYTTGLHNVRELVSLEDYDMCKLDLMLSKYSSGNDVIQLKTSGWHYYVCGALAHPRH